MARLTLDGIGKVFPGGVKALDGISLDVGERELLAVVGPSGCGKSTLLRIVAGLEEETSGRVLLDGRDITGLPPRDRDMAIMFQSYTLFPHLTVEANMAFGLRLRKTPAAEAKARVAEVAGRLGIGDLLGRYPNELSGGQRQRAALGRAILRRPKVFLFDEPLSNLDARMRAQLRVEIGRLHQALESTMIFVTHDQVEAMTLGDRVAVLKAGVIQQVADPVTLYERPANTFVAGFIGSPGMNLFAGSLSAEGRPVFRGGAFSCAVPEGRSESLRAHAGKPILLGIRPEDIGPAAGPGAAEAGPIVAVAVAATAAGTGPGPRLRGRVEVVERLGGQACLHIRAEGAVGPTEPLIAARVEAQGWTAGMSVDLPVSLAKAAFFDPATGKALV